METDIMDLLQLHNKTKLAKTADDILSLSQRYSEITLTPKEAYELAAAEASAYNDSGRVFFGESVLSIMISSFSQSSYLPKEQADFFAELAEIFAYMKNETHDNLSDRAVIAKMYTLWEQKSGGSLKMLRSLIEEEL